MRQTRHSHGGSRDGCANGSEKRSRRRRGSGGEVRGQSEEVTTSNQQPVVIGGSILDLTAKIRSHEIMVGGVVCTILSNMYM